MNVVAIKTDGTTIIGEVEKLTKSFIWIKNLNNGEVIGYERKTFASIKKI